MSWTLQESIARSDFSPRAVASIADIRYSACRGARTPIVSRLILVFVATLPTATTLNPCHGAIVEISLRGFVRVDDPFALLPAEISTGARWSGTIRYDTAVSDAIEDPGAGYYYFDSATPDAFAMILDVEGFRFAGTEGKVGVNNDVTIKPGELSADFVTGDTMRISARASDVPGVPLSSIGMSLRWNDPSANALLGDQLTTNFEPLAFQNAVYHYYGYPPAFLTIGAMDYPKRDRWYEVIAFVEDGSVRVVPEPSALAATLLGLAVVRMFLSSTALRTSRLNPSK